MLSGAFYPSSKAKVYSEVTHKHNDEESNDQIDSKTAFDKFFKEIRAEKLFAYKSIISFGVWTFVIHVVL